MYAMEWGSCLPEDIVAGYAREEALLQDTIRTHDQALNDTEGLREQALLRDMKEIFGDDFSFENLIDPAFLPENRELLDVLAQKMGPEITEGDAAALEKPFSKN